MKLELFLHKLVNKFKDKKIEYCIIRNYERLPKRLEKGDIDFLILNRDKKKIFNVISEINEISIIGITRRSYVHNYFLFNIDKGAKSKSIQIDFIFDFVFKGVKLINTNIILQNKVFLKEKLIYVPNKFDETILKFLPYFLSLGIINNKYENQIINELKKFKKEFTFFFQSLKFEQQFIEKFYNSIIEKNYKSQNKFLKFLRLRFILNNIKNLSIFSHYYSEIFLRIPFKNCVFYKVNFNPFDLSDFIDYIDSSAKEFIFIEKDKFLHYFKLFRQNKNFTIYFLYNKNSRKNTSQILSEIGKLFK